MYAKNKNVKHNIGIEFFKKKNFNIFLFIYNLEGKNI